MSPITRIILAVAVVAVGALGSSLITARSKKRAMQTIVSAALLRTAILLGFLVAFVFAHRYL